MCGIAGIYSAGDRQARRETLLSMAGELAHRGPDGVGLYLDGPFGMVNTRLSIIDLRGGDQPLSNEDGRLWVMQNGEIYNFPELTAELEGLGHRFATRCDTEVLAHAYEQWGPACLDRLNGEFAFAIWDRAREELFLARDRFGVRPLFLADYGGDLCFASEMKAILRHPGATRELDPLALVDVFTMWTTQPDRSAFRGVRELPPGHYLIARADGTRAERRWWDVPFAPRSRTFEQSADELAAELASLLDDATRIRLRADVPVGVYLSGGLDSSATAALARRATSHTLRAFAVGFEDARFDETDQQDAMARALGVELTRVRVGGAEIAEALPRVMDLCETPILRTSPAPLLHLSGLVREHEFKVVLTGEGADELFAGYNIFRETMVRRFWARQPTSKARAALLGRLYPYLGPRLRRSPAFLESFFGAGIQAADDPLYSHRIRFRNTARCLRLLGGDLLAAAGAAGDPEQRLIGRLPPDIDSMGPLSRAQYIEIHTFMTGYLLHSQGDRMLMGNSVEGRFPFLDYRVAEFAARLPERLRLRGLREKHLLRRAVQHLLPAAVSRREKQPYRAPIVAAFVGEQRPEYIDALLDPAAVARVGVFRPEAVSALLRKCERAGAAGVGETDEMGLMGVVSTSLLHHRLVANPTLAAEAKPTRVVVGDAVEGSWQEMPAPAAG